MVFIIKIASWIAWHHCVLCNLDKPGYSDKWLRHKIIYGV